MDDFLKVDQKQLWEELVKLNIGQKKNSRIEVQRNKSLKIKEKNKRDTGNIIDMSRYV